MPGKEQSTNSPATKHGVLIVDDHPIVRQGLAQLISQEDDMEVCGQAEDVQQALRAIRELKPDLVVADVSLKETSGIDLLKDLQVQNPHLPVLMLSMHDETVYAERALRAGARGYIMKQEATERVVTAIRRVLAGDVYISDSMAARMVSKLATPGGRVGGSPVDCLSDRELEVFRLIGEGHSTRQIAARLHLSIKTIETYRAHVKDKLTLKDANELLRAAIEWVNTELGR